MKGSLRFIAALSAAGLILFSGGVAPFAIEVGTAQSSEALTVRHLLDRGEYSKAEPAAETLFATEAARTPRNDEAVQQATDLLIEARCRNGHGAAESTRVFAEAALADAVARTAPDDPRIVSGLRSLGDVQLQAGAYAAAVDSFDRALTLTERFAPDSPAIADILVSLATSLLWGDRWKDAVKTADRAVELLDGAAVDQVRLGRALVAQGEILQLDGQLPRAHDALTRAVKAFDQGNAAPPEIANALSLLGEQFSFESNPTQAYEYLTKGFDLATASLRPGHPDLAKYMRRLATATYELGDPRRARELREQAVKTAEEGLNSTHPAVGLFLNDYAVSLLQDEDYVEGAKAFTRALAIFEKLGPKSSTTTVASYNLGVTLVEMGDHARARPYLERALANWRERTGADSTYTAYGLFGFATLLGAEGRLVEQRAALEQALSIRRQQLGNDSLPVARTLTHLSRAMLRAGAGPAALAPATESVDIWIRANAVASPGYADALSAKGEAEESRGDAEAAEHSYRDAIDALEKAFGPAHPDVGNAKAVLALTLEAAGRHEDAFRVALEAEAIERAHLTATIRYLPERQALRLKDRRNGGLDLALSLSDSSPRSAPTVFDRVIRTRSLILDEMARRHRGAEEGSPDVRALRNQFVELKQRLANLLVKGPGPQGLEAYLKAISALKDESESVERALAERSQELKTEGLTRDAGLIDVQRALPDDSALISLYRVERLEPSALTPAGAARRQADGSRLSVASYFAFVLRSNSLDPVLVSLGAAQSIDDLVRRWHAAVTADIGSPSSPSEEKLRQSGSALRKRVWDPLSAHLKGAARVFIVPDGSLNLVSFSALPTGTRSYILETGPTLHYLSSERDLVAAVGPVPTGRSMLAIGNPSFNDAATFASSNLSTVTADSRASFRGATAACPGFQTMAFESLPSSGSEAREVAALWGQSDGGSAPTVLTGAAADERTFKRLGPSSRVLHLATHGFFLGGDCAPPSPSTRSVGGLVPRKTPTSSTAKAPRPTVPPPVPLPAVRTLGENPLLLSGLALAGANRRASATGDEEDGILTAEEVASMNLAGVEWAVLSACDTGLGEIRAGEGVFGLRRAFQIAGAHTVIMSLWGVGDRSTTVWMRALYEGRLARKLDTAAAVREASLTVLRQRRAKGQSTHPFYWAGFVASGDWR